MVDFAAFEYRQKCEQDRFESYRWGRPWSEADRQNEIASRTVPHIAPENEFNILRSAQLQLLRNRFRGSGVQNYRARPTGLASFRDVEADEKRKNVRELERLMWQFRGRLSFSRCLGWGGQSFASLWTWQNAAGRRRRAVLKNALGAGWIRTSNQNAIDGERGLLRVSRSSTPAAAYPEALAFSAYALVSLMDHTDISSRQAYHPTIQRCQLAWGTSQR